MKNLDFYSDSRFIDIGDLPSGFFPYSFKELYVRAFSLNELHFIHTSYASNNIKHLLRAIDLVISEDVYELAEGDLDFIMAKLRLMSFPETPLLVKWNCSKRNIVYKKDKGFYNESNVSPLQMKIKGLEFEVCGTENNELVHNAKTIVHHVDDDFIGLPQLHDKPRICFPRVSTLSDFNAYIEKQPEYKDIRLAEAARWIEHGTFHDKLQLLVNEPDTELYLHILECMNTYKLGCSETVGLKCRTCDNKLQHTASINKLSYFSNHSDRTILDIKYRLMSEFHIKIDDSMPVKEFLYHNSCLAKDIQDEQAKRNLSKAARRK